ncbi:hypothetical protein [Pleomorphovibrio marinus]|uniref:hypothetical protein n=1 Tax=Pleomorphovibrio marinus TaxID=2164132 RepID=UPI000E0B45FB|nr:hypothetical protein [Pleomorphovibrio marinus]
MKKATFFFCLLMAHSFLFGQKLPDNTQVKWGQEQKFNKKMTLTELAASDETGHYILKRKLLEEMRGSAKLPFLEKYDNNLNFVRSVDLSRGGLPGTPMFEQLLVWEGELWLFFMTDPGKGEREGLYRVAIDPKSLKPKGKSQFVIAAGKKNGKPLLYAMGYGLKSNRSQYHITTYEDQGKILVVHEHAGISNNQKLIDVLVMDSQFNPIWKKEEKLLANSDNLSMVNTLLDANGNVHLLSEDRIKNTKSVFNREKSLFTLTSVVNNGDKTLHKKMELGNHQINQAKIQSDEYSHVYFGGFFTEAKGNKSAGGTYFLKLNGNDQQVIVQKMDEFDAAFLTSGLSNAKARKTSKKLSKGKGVEDSFFQLDQILLKEDGAIAFVGEDRLENVVRSGIGSGTAGPSGSPKHQYRYGNIIVAEFDSNGNRKWAKKVVKDQQSADDAGFFFSYSVSMINNNLYFIYNDHIKNVAYKGQGKVERFNPKKPKEQVMAFVKVDSQGNINRSALSMYNNRNLMTITPVNSQVGYHEMVVYGMHKKKYRLARLAFDPNLVAGH